MRGNSLIEIMVTMAVFGIILAALVSLFSGNEFLITDIQISNEALVKAKINLEEASHSLEDDFSSVLATSSIEGIFTKELIIKDVDNFTKEITSKVSWRQGSRDEKLEISRLIANPRDAFGKSDCELTGRENWSAPSVSGADLDLGFGNQATGIFARGGMVYIITNNASPRDPNADPNDFFIVNASSPSEVAVLSRLDTGPGLSSVVIAGHYAYLGNGSINSQLQIVDISNSQNPQIISTYKLPGNYTDATTIANTLFYYRNKIFLGTAKSQIEELHIIDVTDPLHPREIGKWEAGAAINNIYVIGNFLYLATPNSQELAVLDISDPTLPRKIGGFDAPGGSGNGKSLGQDRATLYLGRTVGKDELFALNISNPTTINSLGSKSILDSINGLALSFGKIFLATNKSFQILDISSSTNIRLINSLPMPQKVTGLSCSGHSIYLSLLGNNGLRIIQPNL